MRYYEIMLEQDADGDVVKLRQLQAKLADMMAQHAENEKIKPEPFDTGKGYSIQTPELAAWYSDPTLGGFWEQNIYPLNTEIENLEAKIKKQRRVGLLQAKAGTIADYDLNEVLYHGTNVDFEKFDRSKVRTASHLYTSPDLETSQAYGDIVYAVYGRQQPQADLTIEDADPALMKKVYQRGQIKKGWDISFRDFYDLVTNGELYSYASHSGLQDDVVSTCLDTLKFRSVRITDAKPGGGFSDSVIFGNVDDLQIIERVE